MDSPALFAWLVSHKPTLPEPEYGNAEHNHLRDTYWIVAGANTVPVGWGENPNK